MSKINTTVSGVTVELSAPYAEGQTISALEANELNSARVVAINQGLRKQVSKLVEEHGITPEVTKQVEELYAEADKTFEFGVKRVRDPLGRECRRIAKDAVDAELKKQGINLADFRKNRKDDYERYLADAAVNPTVVKVAKANIARSANVGLDLDVG